jgi:pimeloyl-ACP methyl ester carboxylesterase
MQALVSNGRRLAYRLNGRPGKKPPLVLVHGFCEDGTVWDPMLPSLRGRRVIRPDLPGFGGSDLPLAPGMETYADAICALLNELAVERCVLVGHSMGGYAALEFAAKYGERLAGLGLFHSHAFVDTAEKKENRRRGLDMLRAGKKDLYVAQLFPSLFAPAYAERHPEVVQALVRRARRFSADGIAAGLEGMIDRRDHHATLRALACPGLFVLGADDTVVTPETALPAAAAPPVAVLHVLPGVGHMGMFEATDAAAQAVRAFVELE